MLDILEYIGGKIYNDFKAKFIMCTDHENRWCTLICKYEDLIPLKDELERVEYNINNDYMVGDKFHRDKVDLWTWIYYTGNKWSYNSNPYMYIRIIKDKGLFVRLWPKALPNYDTIEHALTKAKDIIYLNSLEFKNFINYAKKNKINFKINEKL